MGGHRARAEAVGTGHTEAEVLGRVVGRVVGVVVVGSKGQQDTPAVGSLAQVVGRKVPVGSGARVVGNGFPVGSEALGKVVAVGMQGKARDNALAEVEEGSEAAQAEVQGRAGGRQGRQAGQGSEEEGKKALGLGEVLGLVQPQVQQGQLVVDEGTQVECKVVEWVVHSVEVEEEEDRRG